MECIEMLPGPKTWNQKRLDHLKFMKALRLQELERIPEERRNLEEKLKNYTVLYKYYGHKTREGRRYSRLQLDAVKKLNLITEARKLQEIEMLERMIEKCAQRVVKENKEQLERLQEERIRLDQMESLKEQLFQKYLQKIKRNESSIRNQLYREYLQN